MKKLFVPFGTIFVFISLLSCLDGPKSKEPYTITRTIDKSILDPDVSREMHEVIVKEVIPGNKYVYVLVEEDGRSFWISSGKQQLKKGETYYYNEAILKTQFESKEHNRVFDTLYLVTSLIPEEHGKGVHGLSSGKVGDKQLEIVKKSIVEEQDSTAVFAGRIRIADLVTDPEKYAGKKIELEGICTKVNMGIMGRNWVHLQDGSKDDYDLVITSTETVDPGTEITIQGIVQLNVDFGSGYTYPILVENGVLVQ
ncbi:hypothetical protein ACA086_14005 [Muriicola sp. E247]|uniref:hypothetical protein n=1 Tax=Muriicola sp. E247 TaxID=3242730 RepID=UPI003525A5BA